MNKEELEKLSTKELTKLFDKGELTIQEFDKLRLPQYKQDKLDAKIRDVKKKEIENLYKKARLSTLETIAYETNQLLERNRKNTSTITTILAICFAFSIIAVIVSLYNISQS